MIGVVIGLAVSAVVLYAAMRRGLLFLVFWMGLCLTGCTPAYVVAGTTATALETAIGGYQVYTHNARRALVKGCEDATCREARLAPFELRQRPVLACVEALAPLADAAQAACAAKDAKAAAALLPSLIGPALACQAEIRKAVAK